MRYRSVAIEALCHHVPDVVVKTSAIEGMLSATYERLHIAPGTLEAMTGVRARRFWKPGVQPSDLATRAAEQLLEETGFDRSRIGVLVSTSVCKDFLEPSVAALVHGNLGLSSSSLNFDVGNACLGFMSGMSVVANMIELGQIKAGMVVAGECSREVTHNTLLRLSDRTADIHTYKDNLATLTLGSAAVAMVLTHRSISVGGHRFRGGVSKAATEHAGLCFGGLGGMKTDATRLLSEGVTLAKRTWAEFRNGHFDGALAKHYALHQVGKANHDGVLATLDIPPSKALRIYPELGNVGSASVAIAMKMGMERGLAGPGDRIALMGIGSGLNVSMMAVDLN